MKEKFKRFKNEKIVVNVRSQKQYDKFMQMCEEQGLKWVGGSLPTKQDYYNYYEEETCISLDNLKYLYYCNIDFYKNEGYKIITYEDFMKEGNMKYKIGDKVKVVDAGELYSAYEEFIKENAPQLLNKWVSLRKLPKSGIYEVKAIGWESQPINACFKLDLTHEINPLRDIVEVYEFDKLVWKREEKPVEILDEVEKKWLKNFIKSTNIKVKYIKKWLGVSGVNEYLQIVYDVFNHEYSEYWQENLYLPIFKKGTMYKGLELNKKYTLKELGLDK